MDTQPPESGVSGKRPDCDRIARLKNALLFISLSFAWVLSASPSGDNLVERHGVALTDGPNPVRNIIVDSNGKEILWILMTNHVDIVAGDVLSATFFEEHDVRKACFNVRIDRHVSPRPPKSASAAEILSGSCDQRFVEVEGVVHEVRPDDIDSTIIFLALRVGNEIVYCCGIHNSVDLSRLKGLTGQRVSVRGICHTGNPRRFMGRLIFVPNLNDVVPVRSADNDPFAAPDLESLSIIRPADLMSSERHKVVGTVLAVQRYDRIIHVRTPSGKLVRIDIPYGELPRPNETIEAIGLPETDLFHLNLSHAQYRRTAVTQTPTNETPVSTTLPAIFRSPTGRQRIDPTFDGRLVRLVGTVLSSTSAKTDSGRIVLRADGATISVDASPLSETPCALADGSTVEVTGLCVMDTDTWQPHLAFPRTRGVTVVLRSADDLRILSRPAWWTPRRLTAVIGSLALLLIAIVCWNFVLRRLVERKGRQLFRAQIAQTTSELKVEERTRLAVELHDAISQNLSGASMQIDAAKRLLSRDSDKTAHALDVASKTLDSCREELRNCIWDLRNLALDTQDMNEAIRRTLAHHIGEAKLSVRFNVPRTRLTDNTANAILTIVRELAVNAVRHGHAAVIRIAGGTDDKHLLFSVRDDGCGFNVDNHLGMAQGHFGLQGIRERLKRIQGRLDITSEAGKGTKAVVTIPLRSHPQDGETI